MQLKHLPSFIIAIGEKKMSTQSSLGCSKLPTPPNEMPECRTATYHPCIWGDKFISYVSDEETLCEWREKAETLKGEVRKMLCPDEDYDEFAGRSKAKLGLIASIQRLGVAYHFEDQIAEELARIFTGYHDHVHNDVGGDEDADLTTVALRFRLLREQGYNVTSDVFKCFLDNKGKLKKSLREDVHGLLSLYEATYLRVHGEVILDDALDFTTSSLEALLPHLSRPFLAKQVLHALQRPLRKTLPRLETMNYISVYEQMDNHDDILLAFAKLDFNILQKLHQEEVCLISEWWKELDIENNFHFARDRIVECYFWILGVYTEPQYSRARRFLTQVIAVTSIMDDTYDNYGTKEDLELFTAAIQRWDISAIVDLPEYMKICYLAYFNLHQEAKDELMKQGKPIYGVQSAIEALKVLVRAYFEERIWLETQDVPTVEEYKRVAFVSTSYPMLSITSVVFMGDDATTAEAFEWLLTIPKPAMAAATICRLMDDIVSHKFEQERKHPLSAVECYIAQFGMSEEEACNALRVEIEDGWKDLNEAFLGSTPAANSVLMRMLNLARVMEYLYKKSDGYTHVTPEVKECVTSLLMTSLQV